jgi:hypothetical protein
LIRRFAGGGAEFVFDVREGGRPSVLFVREAEDVVEADLSKMTTRQSRGCFAVRRDCHDCSRRTHDYEERQEDVPKWCHHLCRSFAKAAGVSKREVAVQSKGLSLKLDKEARNPAARNAIKPALGAVVRLESSLKFREGVSELANVLVEKLHYLLKYTSNDYTHLPATVYRPHAPRERA